MKRKQLDHLIEAVFENGEQASSPQDAESAAEWTRLVAMRQDLKLLTDVPECQLSVESMRDAVLRREMGARIRVPIWIALGSPVAAAMIVAVFWPLFHRPEPNPVQNPIIVRNVQPAQLVPDRNYETLIPHGLAFLSNASTSAITPIDGAKVASPTRKSMAASRRRIVRSRANRSDALIVALNSARGATNQPVDRPAVPAEHIGTIVIINPDVDVSTGAKTANEVGTGSNVVIGG